MFMVKMIAINFICQHLNLMTLHINFIKSDVLSAA